MAKKGVSAEKAFRRSLRQRAVNRARDRSVRHAVRTARESIASSVDNSAEAVKSAAVALDRAAAHGTIHPNAAARRKSRLTRRLNQATAAS